jgi:hypothetical protein
MLRLSQLATAENLELMLIASLAGMLRLSQLATAENLELMLIASLADKLPPNPTSYRLKSGADAY